MKGINLSRGEVPTRTLPLPVLGRRREVRGPFPLRLLPKPGGIKGKVSIKLFFSALP
jgi:hypothetical protein